jgi:protein-S-isoprenylcysteine O-methyltransferase Ste14
VRGLHRYTRNPMYLAVIGIVLSEALFFASVHLLIYGCILFIAFNIFVVIYEEPTLKKQFGDSYLQYQRKVPRWRVRFKLE